MNSRDGRVPPPHGEVDKDVLFTTSHQQRVPGGCVQRHGGAAPSTSCVITSTPVSASNSTTNMYNTSDEVMPRQHPILPQDRSTVTSAASDAHMEDLPAQFEVPHFMAQSKEINEHLVYQPRNPQHPLLPTQPTKSAPKTPKPRSTSSAGVVLNDPPEGPSSSIQTQQLSDREKISPRDMEKRRLTLQQQQNGPMNFDIRPRVAETTDRVGGGQQSVSLPEREASVVSADRTAGQAVNNLQLMQSHNYVELDVIGNGKLELVCDIECNYYRSLSILLR